MFSEVDMFDLDPKRVKVAKQLVTTHPSVKRVEQRSFSTWKWQCTYDAVFLCWSAGYLDDAALEEWLKMAAAHLNNPKSRSLERTCFIWLLDNVAPAGVEFEENGQRIRSPERLMGIFRAAGLHIHWQSQEIQLHHLYGVVILWALC